MEDFRRDEVSSKAKNRSCRSATIKRTITVHASSEIACPPDLCSLTISVSSTKETAEAAQNSVKRRGEYIMQVLCNNSIKERLVRKSTDVNRVSEDEVCVQTDSLQVCEAVRNLDREDGCYSAVQYDRSAPFTGIQSRGKVCSYMYMYM